MCVRGALDRLTGLIVATPAGFYAPALADEDAIPLSDQAEALGGPGATLLGRVARSALA